MRDPIAGNKIPSNRIDPVTQGLAFDIRHDVVEAAVDRSGVVDREDVRVGEVGRDLDFPHEPLSAHRQGEVGQEHLQGDGATMLQVLRKVNNAMAPATELALDHVAVRQCSGESSGNVRHPGHREQLTAGPTAGKELERVAGGEHHLPARFEVLNRVPFRER